MISLKDFYFFSMSRLHNTWKMTIMIWEGSTHAYLCTWNNFVEIIQGCGLKYLNAIWVSSSSHKSTEFTIKSLCCLSKKKNLQKARVPQFFHVTSNVAEANERWSKERERERCKHVFKDKLSQFTPLLFLSFDISSAVALSLFITLFSMCVCVWVEVGEKIVWWKNKRIK